MTDNFRSRHRISRRKVLAGLSGITLSLPWLEKLDGTAHAQAQPNRPKRVIVMAYEMGVAGGEWRPSAVGANFTLPYTTAPLEAYKDRCLFVSSLDNRVLEIGGHAFAWGHPAKREAALTGTLTTAAFAAANNNHISEVRSGAAADGGANGPSVEHVIGESLRNGHAFSSIDLGINDTSGAGPADSEPSNFFFEGRGNAISLLFNPRAALDQLFAGIGTGDQPDAAAVELARLRARKKSALDAVRDSFNELKQGLGREDRLRLEEHAAKIRQLEIDIVQPGTCSLPSGIPNDAFANQTLTDMAAYQTRILAHAMGCGLAPVGRLEFTNQQNPRFGIQELDSVLVNGYGWHGMVHGDPVPGTNAYTRPGRDGATGPYDRRLLAGYRFYVQAFANLLAELDSIPDGPESSVLDTSLVILASDFGDGLGHGHMKMAYIAAGNLGGARRGYHFDAGPARSFDTSFDYFYAESKYNVNQFLNSLLDMAGVTNSSGNPASVGLGGYLEQLGAPRRIDGLFA